MAPPSTKSHTTNNSEQETPSPSDTRHHSRFESVVAEPESIDGESTVRRTRPSAITTQGDTTYGSITNNPEASHQQQQQQQQQQQAASQEQGRQSVGSSEASFHKNLFSPELSQQSGQAPRKPSLSRRSSSRHQTPHRGQEFSVHDDVDEYQSDQQRHVSSGYVPPLRRQGSKHLRRRQTMPRSPLPPVDSGEEDNVAMYMPRSAPPPTSVQEQDAGAAEEEEEEEEAEEDQVDADIEDDDDDDGISDAESFTLKDRQQAINQTHPFGIRIWKPALYKKNRSVEKTAEGDIHSAPGGRVSKWLQLFNLLWTVIFGWWLALASFLGSLACYVFGIVAPSAPEYASILWQLAWYLLYPFGKFVLLQQDEAYADEDEGEGRSITEYEQWQSGDLEDGRLFFGPLNSGGLVGRRRNSLDSADENDSLLGHSRSGVSREGHRTTASHTKRRLFGRGQWTVGRVVFFGFFYLLIAPLMLLACGICWFLVFWIPMSKVTLLLFSHLRRHPLALSFHSDAAFSRSTSAPSSILVCTYRAAGLKYWKYTLDGTNIFLINLIGIVLFTIFDYWVLDVALGLNTFLVHPGLVFSLSLFSVIPLAYFIGQAVASISAQSSMGVGAVTNAFFSTIVEVFLYCVALREGKGQLVEGSIVGSIFAGILFLPGLSMCFGAVRRKTQRFNVKSAGVTSTMLLFAVIAAFGPTLFYQIYGSHELNCGDCISSSGSLPGECRICYYTQVPAITDRFYTTAVRPYCWFSAVMLFLSYLIGLWFTLRTHAAVIWNEAEEKKTQIVFGPNGAISVPPTAPPTARPHATSVSAPPGSRSNTVKESQVYKRILDQSLRQIGLNSTKGTENRDDSSTAVQNSSSPPPSQPTPFLVPPKAGNNAGASPVDSNKLIDGLSPEQNEHLIRQVTEMAATAAAIAARDVANGPRKSHVVVPLPSATHQPHKKTPSRPPTVVGDHDDTAGGDAGGHGGGHDAPNWSKRKSTVILLGATVLYAVIAEILVNTVDVVLMNVDIDEKFLGITLFALVPNTTEFLNAISFAMNGNIALSMEIGSAYALQVELLQIPALVLFSAIYGNWLSTEELTSHTFNLIFPQWDMITVILCVFLLSYVYGEGKSNYFKGSILVLAYFVIVLGYYLSGMAANMEVVGLDRLDVVPPRESRVFRTVGRGTSGIAY